MQLLKNLLNLISWLIILLFGLIVFVSFGNNFGFVTDYKSFVVQSGSMEPTIHIGDIILVKKSPYYSQNEIITFYDEKGRIVTHRIIKKVNEGFITKGDANSTPDVNPVPKEKIIGKVIFIIPKLGFLAYFAKTPLGLFLFVAIPIALLSLDKFLNLKKNA